MFWANTTPLPDATTDFGVISPRITVNGTIRSCEVGTRGLVCAGRVVVDGVVVDDDVGAPVVVVGLRSVVQPRRCNGGRGSLADP